MHAAALPLPPTLRVVQRGWLSANALLADDGDAVAIVDTGYHTHAAQTVALVEQWAVGRPLTRIFNTHLHSDHVGGNAALQGRWPQARIAIPPGESAAVSAWNEEALTYRATGQHCPRFAWDALIEPGARLDLGGVAWEVLGAPGHDPHMVMLYAPAEGVLVSADALWEHGFGAIFPEIEGESGFAEQRAALALVAQVRPRAVIPGHGAPFADVGAALARAHARLAALEADPARNARQVLKALLMFWLLEVRAASLAQAVEHFGTARWFRTVHARYFGAASFEAMIARTARELQESGAAHFDGETLAHAA